MALNLENKKQIATILLAVGLGLVAAVLTGQYVQTSIENQTKTLAKDYQKKNAILVQELEKIKSEFKKVAQNQAALAKKVKERRVIVQQAPAKVSGPAPQAAFSLRTPPGKRAITILIDSLSAVGGLIASGDIVDIIAEMEMPDLNDTDAKRVKVTTMLFQNIEVLAVGTKFTPSAQNSEYQAQQVARNLNVTLAVSPEEAGLLTFAQANGKLKLSLRSPTERGKHILQVASWDTLSDYVLEQQGTELVVPKGRAKIKEVDGKPKKTKSSSSEVKPFIQIFKGGQEL